MIERAAADRLGLAEFGELYVAGMAGRLRSRFRRARTLRLGPLTLRNPLFMCALLLGCLPRITLLAGASLIWWHAWLYVHAALHSQAAIHGHVEHVPTHCPQSCIARSF